MIPLMKHAFFAPEKTQQALAEFVAQADRFSMGPQCRSFEQQFAAYQGSRDAILYNSGSSANLAIFQALRNLGRVSAGQRVGFSALTWATNVMPLFQLGLEPIPLDCSSTTLNVMSSDLEAQLSETKLDALFITHALGFAGDLPQITRICKERNILLIEDNCEALGTVLRDDGRKTGQFGTAATFSFYIAHHLSTIEGGMVCTDDEELADMLRMVRAHGWDRDLAPEKQQALRDRHGLDSDFAAKYAFYDLAYNLRPTEITGFLGNQQLPFVEAGVRQRAVNYETLATAAQDNPQLIALDRAHIETLSSFGFPVLAKDAQTKAAILEKFVEAEVEVRPMIAGNIQNQPFYQKYAQQQFAVPGADQIHHAGFYCGNYPDLSEEDLATISTCLRG